ncbi:MAG TPA: hypothetical protein VMA53_22355 [Stellaceae bacterium]|nr:hypothetical protein [Stellaceae bacterium]
MIDRDRHRRTWRLAFLAFASALSLAACAQSGYSGSTSRGGYVDPNPYHYRCTGNCQAGG